MAERVFVPMPTNEAGQVQTGQQPTQNSDGQARQEARWEGGTFVPATGAHAHSLHRLHMPVRQVEVEAVWEPNRFAPDVHELKYRPRVEEQAPQGPNVLEMARGQLNNLQDVVRGVMAGQYSGGNDNQGGGEIGAPDPMAYDFYDPQSAAEYNQALNAHVAQLAAQRANEALSPYREALKVAEHERHYSELAQEHGDDPNFKDALRAALQLMKDDPTLSMLDAYKTAADPKNAKLGAKGNAHLPEALSSAYRTGYNGKRVRNPNASLGQIMMHNIQSGRAAPPKKKSNRWGF